MMGGEGRIGGGLMGLGVGGVDGGRVVGVRGILLVLVLFTKGDGGGAVGVVRRTCSKGRRGKGKGMSFGHSLVQNV